MGVKYGSGFMSHCHPLNVFVDPATWSGKEHISHMVV